MPCLVLVSSSSLPCKAQIRKWLHHSEHTCLLLQTMEATGDQTTTVCSFPSCPWPSVSAPWHAAMTMFQPCSCMLLVSDFISAWQLHAKAAGHRAAPSFSRMLDAAWWWPFMHLYSPMPGGWQSLVQAMDHAASLTMQAQCS